MDDKATTRTWLDSAGRRSALIGLLILVAIAGYLRLEGLGTRSLWRDELCTWHVSRMPLGASLRWGPELTKPPLYQFALRLLTSDAHPSESTLRTPAAICGIAVVLVGFCFGVMVGGPWLGFAFGFLLALNAQQIYYSQEARPYSMLVLGTALSTVLWYRYVATAARSLLVGYVATIVLTLYAHYLAVLTILAHGVWWLILFARRSVGRSLAPLIALGVTGLLCVPLVVRYLLYRTAIFQGLEWIKTPTVADALHVLAQLTAGSWWLIVLLVALALWVVGHFGFSIRWRFRPGGAIYAGPKDVALLLVLVVVFSWGGLLAISWLAHPAMVGRYALPASFAALLLPLLIAHRIDKRLPSVVALYFAALTSPVWLNREVEPGLREMAAFLRENVDPKTEAVVQTLDATLYPGWEDSERIIFDYYPLGSLPLLELRLATDNVTATNDVLKDPRGLWLLVLWADEQAIVQRAGRSIIPFQVDAGHSVDRLLFSPHRLVHIAPL